MKKTVTLIFAFFASIFTVLAQPTLTGATNNPVPGDGFYGHVVDTAGVTMGASGASATWSFAAITASGVMDTNYYYTCPTSPVCDSFPTSNIVGYNNIDWTYEIANSSMFALIGEDSGSIVAHLVGSYKILSYPFTYTNTYKDTFTLVVSALGAYVYIKTIDTTIADGYGTLMLPTGTYTNVLRLHKTTLVQDSIYFMGVPIVSTSQTQTYLWYNIAGFHNPLYVVTYDTAGSTTPYVSNAEYYTTALPLGLNQSLSNDASLSVYPNPAGNVININFNLVDNQSTTIMLYDVMGRAINTVTCDKMNPGMNTVSLPASTLPPGIYMVRLQSASGSLSQKVVVEK